MGQHKTNPTAIAAKEGKIPPKPERPSKRELDRQLYAKCQEIIYGRFMDAYEKIQKEEGFE